MAYLVLGVLLCQVNYLIDKAAVISKGANSVISYLHHFLEHYGLAEKHLILHADNCAYVLFYSARSKKIMLLKAC